MKHISTITKPMIAVALMCLSFAGNVRAGTVVVNNDEWTLSDTGFANAPDAGQFVSNIVGEFGPKIHAYSTNFSFTGSSLANAMSSAGATYSTGLGFSFDVPNLAMFDGILLGGNYLAASELVALDSYVSSGGNVYIAGGTGVGGPAAEAASWNGFLSGYGIQMGSPYNGVIGNVAVSGDPLLNGVSALYQNNGNGLTGTSVVCCGSGGLYAVNRGVVTPVPPKPNPPVPGPTPVPLPASFLIFLTSLLLVGLPFSFSRKKII